MGMEVWVLVRCVIDRLLCGLVCYTMVKCNHYDLVFLSPLPSYFFVLQFSTMCSLGLIIPYSCVLKEHVNLKNNEGRQDAHTLKILLNFDLVRIFTF